MRSTAKYLAIWSITHSLCASSAAEGAVTPKLGLNKRVDVVCIRFTDIPTPTKPNCQAWVDQLNNEVSPWYLNVSDQQVALVFQKAPYQAGATPPPNDWIPIPHMSSVGFYINNVNQFVQPAVDALIDFSGINIYVIISAGLSHFGQAVGSMRGASHGDLAFAEIYATEGRELGVESPAGVWHDARRIAIVLLGEHGSLGPMPAPQPHYQSMTAVHELGHLYHFPDRYFPYTLNGSQRDYGTGYTPMGSQWAGPPPPSAIANHFLAAEQHWMGFAPLAAPAVVAARPTFAQTYNLVIPSKINFLPNTTSLIRIPVEGSGPGYDDFRGYTAEARIRDESSATSDWVLQTGVVVTWIDPTVDEKQKRVKVMDDPNSPGNLFDAAYEVNDIMSDQGRGVTIQVMGTIADGYSVKVTNVLPTILRADPKITEWNADGQETWETPDIWIDRESNGWDFYDSTSGNRDAPAVRSSPARPTQMNRVYFRVTNDGDGTAQNYSAKIYFAAPGINQTSWSLIGAQPLGAIAAHQSEVHFVNWVVPDGFAGGNAHACIKVEITNDGTDLNPANNVAQENIFAFPLCQHNVRHLSLLI